MKASLREEVHQAHERFKRDEPRAFVYELALGETRRSVVNGILLLLLIWNREAYQNMDRHAFFRFLGRHKVELESAIAKIEPVLALFKSEGLETVNLSKHGEAIKQIFVELCTPKKMGPTAAGKALHLLQPQLFMMWDDNIREGHGLAEIEKVAGERSLKKRDYIEYYAGAYVTFMDRMQKLAKSLLADCSIDTVIEENDGYTLPKLLDEYNYCVYTLKQ